MLDVAGHVQLMSRRTSSDAVDELDVEEWLCGSTSRFQWGPVAQPGSFGSCGGCDRAVTMIGVDVVAEGVVEIAMRRPERRNALTLEMLEEMSVAVERAAADLAARVILLTGDGSSFCAGADLTAVHNPDLPRGSESGLGSARIWEQLGEVAVPVVAVVQGYAMTGGLHLALCCDLIVAAEDAVFRDTHAAFGLVPGSGEIQRYTRRLGVSLAREMLFASRSVSGAEAARKGFVARAVPAAALRASALELAAEIAANSPRAVGHIKKMLNGGLDSSYSEAQWADYRLNGRGQLNLEPDPDRDERLRRFAQRRRR